MAQEPENIIVSYTDAQALEDGVLVEVDDLQVNRVTRAVFDHFTLPMGSSTATGVVINITPLRGVFQTMLAVEADAEGWRVVTLARGLFGTDRILPFAGSSRSRLPVLLPSIKRGCRKSYGVCRLGPFRLGLCRTCGTRNAGQVRTETQPMAGQESTASQAKSGGSREGHASVSLGSAGAGEGKLRNISKRSLVVVRSIRFTSSE
jgi:hypothetical protein